MSEKMAERKPLSLYVHIPFCVHKCNYCDFLSFGQSSFDCQKREVQNDYVRALKVEIESYQEVSPDYEVETIYFGGGTPSILQAELLTSILEQIYEVFEVSENAEITVECNPGTTSFKQFQNYRLAGVNRLSLGLQTTNDKLLKTLGRIHTYDEFRSQYEDARRAGFDNINVDLMSALPGQSLEEYEQDLEQIVALNPEHISSYGLIIEEHTPFYKDEKIQELLPPEEVAVAMYERTKAKLKKSGYERYEISNYAKVGYESRHNSGYWTGRAYLGLGLGASSYLADYRGQYYRYHNQTNLRQYEATFEKVMTMKELREFAWEEIDKLEKKDRIEEFMFLGLRMCQGVSYEEFERRFGETMTSYYEEVIVRYRRQQLLYQYEKRGEHYLAFTEEGMIVSNPVMADFMLS